MGDTEKLEVASVCAPARPQADGPAKGWRYKFSFKPHGALSHWTTRALHGSKDLC